MKNSETVSNTWGILSQYIKDSSKQIAAEHLVNELVDVGVLDDEDLEELASDADGHISAAAKEHVDDIDYTDFDE